MVAVAMVTVVVVAVGKVLEWVAVTINKVVVVEVLGIDVLADVEFIVVAVIVIGLKFALPESYSVDVPSDVTVDLVMDVDVILRVLIGIGIDVFADVDANAFAAVTALEFPV